MPIIATASSEYALHPAGLAQAVCVDVVDVGEVNQTDPKGKVKKVHKVQIIWQSEEIDDKRSSPIQLKRRYTLSLNEKASLRKDLESWRGRPFNDEELKGFDLEKLIGINAFINVIHNSHDGQTYANVASISPVKKGTTPLIPTKEYVRVKDRPVDGNGAPPIDESPINDGDVPF